MPRERPERQTHITREGPCSSMFREKAGAGERPAFSMAFLAPDVSSCRAAELLQSSPRAEGPGTELPLHPPPLEDHCREGNLLLYSVFAIAKRTINSGVRNTVPFCCKLELFCNIWVQKLDVHRFTETPCLAMSWASPRVSYWGGGGGTS